MEALCNYHWPGNVRELENFIECSVILSRGAELESPLAELSSVPVAAAAAAGDGPCVPDKSTSAQWKTWNAATSKKCCDMSTA